MIVIRESEAEDITSCVALRPIYTTRLVWKVAREGLAVPPATPGMHGSAGLPGTSLLSFHVQQTHLPRERLIALPSASIPLSDTWADYTARFVALDLEIEEDDHSSDAPSETDRSAFAVNQPVILGYICLQLLADQRQARIARLLVDLSARRQGIGSALLRTARLWAHNTGCMALQGHVPLRNVPGIRFYQHRGLSICGLIERFYPTLEDALLLMQPL